MSRLPALRKFLILIIILLLFRLVAVEAKQADEIPMFSPATPVPSHA